ncbi:prepilin-type N-terminal cleavage/methylation domain-containing protein [Akkermansiaceae bacterium]|nr:prepilin-type N-terminal cleavage/methylation domain-containing protein [Akkermansiaceae bacterium]
MKTNAPKASPSRGFTLIELLVVISIIAILATMGVSGYRIAMEKARRTSAHVAMNNLVHACNNYYEDYSQLPLNGGVVEDQERLSDNKLMPVLLGLESASEDNPKLTSYFTHHKAKGKGAHKYGGLDRSDTHARLYGPWKNDNESDRHYRIVMDYDFNKMISEPNDLGGGVQYDQRVLIYHLGKDGEAGPGKNRDNVYSYK